MKLNVNLNIRLDENAKLMRTLARLVVRAERQCVDLDDTDAMREWVISKGASDVDAMVAALQKIPAVCAEAGISVRQAAGIFPGKIVSDRDGIVTKMIVNGQGVDGAVGQAEYAVITQGQVYVVSQRDMRGGGVEYLIELESDL